MVTAETARAEANAASRDIGRADPDERPAKIERTDAPAVWLHDFGMLYDHGRELEIDAIKEKFQNAFLRIWRGDVEDEESVPVFPLPLSPFLDPASLRRRGRIEAARRGGGLVELAATPPPVHHVGGARATGCPLPSFCLI